MTLSLTIFRSLFLSLFTLILIALTSFLLYPPFTRTYFKVRSCPSSHPLSAHAAVVCPWFRANHDPYPPWRAVLGHPHRSSGPHGWRCAVCLVTCYYSCRPVRRREVLGRDRVAYSMELVLQMQCFSASEGEYRTASR